MHTEYFLIDEGGDRQAIEAICERFPDAYIQTPLALVVKPVHTIDSCRFVIAAQQKEILRILYLVSKQEANSLDGLLATVDIVAEKKIVGVWGEPTILKKSQ